MEGNKLLSGSTCAVPVPRQSSLQQGANAGRQTAGPATEETLAQRTAQATGDRAGWRGGPSGQARGGRGAGAGVAGSRHR